MLMLSRTTRTPLFSPEKKYFVTAAHMPYIIENFRPSWLARPPTVGPNVKIPPKSRFEKFVKMTDHTYACNSLTNFEEETMTGNGNHVTMLKLTLENS